MPCFGGYRVLSFGDPKEKGLEDGVFLFDASLILRLSISKAYFGVLNVSQNIGSLLLQYH